MKESLKNKLIYLSPKENNSFYNRLCNILESHYNSFVYGGISDKEYPDPPKEKLEKVEERVYNEMFGCKHSFSLN